MHAPEACCGWHCSTERHRKHVTGPDQEPNTRLHMSPLQVAHHSLSEAGSRGGEGGEPEGLGLDERSITSTSSRGALPRHPGHR